MDRFLQGIKKQSSCPPVIIIMCVLMGLVGLLISPLLCVMTFLGGAGFSSSQAGAMMVTGMSVDHTSVAFFSAMIMACFNLGMFLCSPFQAMVGKITGDALYVPLYIGAVVYILCAVFFVIYNPISEKKAARS